MAVQKIISDDNSLNNKTELSYNEWIDANMENICNHKSGRIKYVNTNNKSPNKVETDKIAQELSLLDLADANAMSATLRPLGEHVCKVGGWLRHLEIEQQVDTLKKFNQTQKEELEIELAKSNIEANRLNARIAERNGRDSRFNKIFLIINAVFAAINVLILILQ